VAKNNGSTVSSGNNKGQANSKTLSILYLNANFVKDGNVTYKYKVGDGAETAGHSLP
jgi:hypothetical protein